MGIEISGQDKEELLAGYKVLPPFGDASEALPELKQAGFRLFAFSNGKPEDVASLLENSGISSYFEDVVSTDEIKSFQAEPGSLCPFPQTNRSNGQGGLADLRQPL